MTFSIESALRYLKDHVLSGYQLRAILEDLKSQVDFLYTRAVDLNAGTLVLEAENLREEIDAALIRQGYLEDLLNPYKTFLTSQVQLAGLGQSESGYWFGVQPCTLANDPEACYQNFFDFPTFVNFPREKSGESSCYIAPGIVGNCNPYQAIANVSNGHQDLSQGTGPIYVAGLFWPFALMSGAVAVAGFLYYQKLSVEKATANVNFLADVLNKLAGSEITEGQAEALIDAYVSGLSGGSALSSIASYAIFAFIGYSLLSSK